jgi:hypothetical protein
MRFWNSNRYEIVPTGDGATAETLPAAAHVGSLVTRGFAEYVLGSPSAHVATLENARAHTIAVNGASEATPVRAIPSQYIQVVPGPDGHPLRTLPGIEDALLACAADGQMLHESTRAVWSTPAGSKQLLGYSHFAAPSSARPAVVRELV